jgi:hypothetical protein
VAPSRERARRSTIIVGIEQARRRMQRSSASDSRGLAEQSEMRQRRKWRGGIGLFIDATGASFNGRN